MERQEALKELLDLGGPSGAMVAPGELDGEVGRVLKPCGSQAKEMSTTDAQEVGGSVRVQLAPIEGVEGLVEEL